MKSLRTARPAILWLVCLLLSVILTACGGSETTPLPTQTAAGSVSAGTPGTASPTLASVPPATTGPAATSSPGLSPAATAATTTATAAPGLVTPPTQVVPAPAEASGPDAFYAGETGHFVKSPFLAYWQKFGGKNVFGNPLSETFTQDGFQAQLFEQALLEYHPEQAGKPGEFQLGFLGRELAEAERLLPGDPAFAPVTARANTPAESYFPETQHTLASPFKAYWESNGLLKFLGYPISQPMNRNGLTVQYFERGRLEYNPDTKKVGYSNSGDLLIAAAGWPHPQKFDLRLNLPETLTTTQGQTLEIQLSGEAGWQPPDLQGKFAASSLKFAPLKVGPEGVTVSRAYQAVDPSLVPQVYPLTLTFTDKQGQPRAITRSIKVGVHDYGTQDLGLYGSLDALADHNADDYDNAQLAQAYATFSPNLLWQGVWQWPLKVPWTQTTDFAQRRIFNGKLDTLYYHGGIDLAPNSGSNGANVHTGAAGKVIYTGSLKARGLSVVVDHGLGITSYYFHLGQINVQVGQMLDSDAVVGLVGSTGRATGPHLDWEVRINGIITDPRNFLQQDLAQ